MKKANNKATFYNKKLGDMKLNRKVLIEINKT